MNLHVFFMTNNPRYRQHKPLKPKGLVLHSVGVNQPSAQVFIKQWNQPNFRKSCVHGIIDGFTGDVYQLLPWDNAGWHAGETANSTHIGVEMCEPAQIKYTKGAQFTCSDLTAARAVALRTYNSAVELFAMLCDKFDLNPYTDILSHKEAHAKGIATNHGDPDHLWSGLGMNLTMGTFRSAVSKQMSGQLQNGSENTSFQPFRVRVVVTNLNIRTKPTTAAKSLGHIPPGVYTIVEEQDGWGLLKSYQAKRDGWIYLQYANRI